MLVVPEAGLFVQEYGEPIAIAALEHFESLRANTRFA